MAKVKVETIAVINHNSIGSSIELPKSTAEKLSAKGYVKIIGEVKPKPKKVAAPKKTAKKTDNKEET